MGEDEELLLRAFGEEWHFQFTSKKKIDKKKMRYKNRDGHAVIMNTGKVKRKKKYRTTWVEITNATKAWHIVRMVELWEWVSHDHKVVMDWGSYGYDG